VVVLGVIILAVVNSNGTAGTNKNDQGTSSASQTTGTYWGSSGGEETDDPVSALTPPDPAAEPAENPTPPPDPKPSEMPEPRREDPQTKAPDPDEPDEDKPSRFAWRHDPLPEFEATSGTAPEKIEEIKSLVKITVDPNETVGANRASASLEQIGKPAIPFVINELLKVNVDGDLNQILAGQMLHNILKHITKLPNRGAWDREQDDKGGYWRSRARRDWHTWWTKNQSTWTGPTDDEGEG
jgi:hypothetical protein